MTRTTHRRRLIRLAAPLAAVTLFVASPAPRQATASSCGENNGPMCRKNESCISIIFFKQCTTKYDYYPGTM